jgi:hypothetical protein
MNRVWRALPHPLGNGGGRGTPPVPRSAVASVQTQTSKLEERGHEQDSAASSTDDNINDNSYNAV